MEEELFDFGIPELDPEELRKAKKQALKDIRDENDKHASNSRGITQKAQGDNGDNGYVESTK